MSGRSFIDSIEVVVTPLNPGYQAVRAAEGLLSLEERARAGRFVFADDRRRYTVARAQLRRLLGERLNEHPGDVELIYGARGKPALAPCHAGSGLRFNVSHCGDVAVHAFARGREIGVDVEAVRELADADHIAARFFSTVEQEAYRALAAEDRPLGFFNCWTRKEAYIKALGAGLAHPLKRFDVSLAPGEPARLLRVDDTAGEDCGWTLHGFDPAAGYVGAVVVGRFADAGPERLVVRPATALN